MNPTEAIYPAGPASVPPNLTAPTPRYKRHAWIAVAALLLFSAVYLGLATWFAWQAWHMLLNAIAGGEHAVRGFAFGITSAFFAAFLLKGLFFVKQGDQSQIVELKASDEPALFEFLYKLADEAQAPRPHRVFVSAAVNAAVFYDLSIANVLFPSRKNLEIGLALVNVLTLGELKAVLAHEFGHFAQRSMAVGRWVYIAQQIAGHMVSRRDGFDRFLDSLARLDIRIAWVGWLLSLIVWSLRSLIEMSFRLLLLAQRALSREMEMQADLVAVSLTGSDALVHALHKTSAAEDAWNRTIAFANREYGKGRRIRDLLTVQSRIINHLRMAYDDSQYGRSPVVPEVEASKYRVFKAEFAQLPQMWATHPLNHEREQNAKKNYVAAPLDHRSAWTVFLDAKVVRERVSAALLKESNRAVILESDHDALANVDEEYSQEFLNRFYRSVYLGRSVVRHAKSVNDLYENFAPLPNDPLKKIYPAALSAELEALRELQREAAMLKAIGDGAVLTAGKAIQYRGKQLDRKDLAQAIAEVEAQLAAEEARIQAHDRLCRSAHMELARRYGGGWDTYLKSLLGLMHYADHSAADLRDTYRVTGDVVHVVTAAGKVSKAKLARLIASCNQLYSCLKAVYDNSAAVEPGTAVLTRADVENWGRHFGEFRFVEPDDGNINEWLRNVDSWINAAVVNFRLLYESALAELLKTEAMLAKAAHTPEVQLADAPAPAVFPLTYPVLTPGSERPSEQRLDWWSRFQQADGKLATIGKLTAALSLVALVLIVGSLNGRADLTVYNGLASSVQVTVDGKMVLVPPNSFAEVKLPADDDVEIGAMTGNVEIEHFKQHISNRLSHYVYNVARASVFIEWTAVYGNARPTAPQALGNPRWTEVAVDDLFTEPPGSVSTKSGGDVRRVLSSTSNESPMTQLNPLKNRDDAAASILAHVRYDPPNTLHLSEWLAVMQAVPNGGEVLAARLQRYPNDVYALRAEQDIASPAQRQVVCQKHTEMAKKEPENGDLQYLAIRCMPHGETQARAFLSAAEHWPRNPWLNLGAAYTELDAEHLDEATRHFAITFAQMPGVRSWATIDIARLRRLQNPNANLDDLIKGSLLLDSYHDLETNLKQEGPALAWTTFIHGDLQRAHQLLPAGKRGLSLSILLAASDGAPREWASQVLSLSPDQDWSPDMLLYCLALATREHRDVAPYLTRLNADGGEDGQQMLSLFQTLQMGKLSDENAEARNLSLRSRGQLYALAAITRGRDVSQKWRADAKNLLFGTERPYFN